MFHATALITECFQTNEIHYQIVSPEESPAEIVEVPCPIPGGPIVNACLISTDDNNDVGVRIFSLVTQVQKEKRMAVLKACNRLNASYRFITFELDRDNDVCAAFDFPAATSDESLGHSVMEILTRVVGILEDVYPLLMKAMYGKEADMQSTLREKKLSLLRRILHGLDSAEKPEVLSRVSREKVQAMIDHLESESEDEDNARNDADLPC